MAADFKPICYLLKPSKKECFYLGYGFWVNIFPDAINGTNVSNAFKYKDIFTDRKMAKASYRKYINDTVNPNTELTPADVDLILKKVCKWAGNDDIMFAQPYYAEDKYILTGSCNPYDLLGKKSHYLKMALRFINAMRSSFRIFKLGKLQRMFKKKSTMKRVVDPFGVTYPSTSNRIIFDQEDINRRLNELR